MHVFPPFGACIYCGSTEQPLGKEHIVPYGLCGGNQFILPHASCEAHSKVTSKFELEVLRGPMWPVRAHLQLRSRRAALAPKTAPLTFVKADGTTVDEQVTLADHPLTLLFPLLHPPSELTGDHRRGISIRGELTYRFGKLPDRAFMQAREATGIRIKQTYRLVQFAQLLGKIAWGFAAGQGLLAHVDREDCALAALISQPDAIGRWVGSVDEGPTMAAPAPSAGSLHEILAFERRGYLLYRVQLFVSHRTPYYWVVVGKLKGSRPTIEDPIVAPPMRDGATFIEELRSLQPGATLATGPSLMTGLKVEPKRSNS